MKKLSIFLICSVLLVACFTFSVSAEENYTISGMWKTPAGTTLNIVADIDENVSFVYDTGVAYVRMASYYSESTNEYGLNLFSADGNVNSLGFGFDSRERTFDFGDVPQSVSAEFFNFINTNFVSMVCDGSSCPATDLNYDNVCDDCGLTFSVPRNYAPSDWNTAFPVPPSVYDSYTVLTVDGVTYLYMVNGEVPSITISDPDAEGKRTLHFIMVGQHPSVSIQRYQLINGAWAYDSVNSIRSFTFNDTLKIEYTTVPVLDSSGQPFFPLPLWAEVGEMTTAELPTLQTIVVGALQILTVCGVGCLTLLMALNLFGKVLLPFLKQ